MQIALWHRGSTDPAGWSYALVGKLPEGTPSHVSSQRTDSRPVAVGDCAIDVGGCYRLESRRPYATGDVAQFVRATWF